MMAGVLIIPAIGKLASTGFSFDQKTHEPQKKRRPRRTGVD
jgi:hypothetical protein